MRPDTGQITPKAPIREDASLDPQARELVQMAQASGQPPLAELTVARAREMSNLVVDMIGRGPEMAAVRDIALRGHDGVVPAREYIPSSRTMATVVYFHAGGWVLGTLQTADALCRTLAREAQSVVVSVDYRLAPEHPFPAAVTDAWTAVSSVAQRSLGREPVVVAGDSAGGNLAAVSAVRARDAGLPLALQVLAYPVTDHDFGRPSYRRHGQDGLLTRSDMEWFWDHYAPNAERHRPEASPLRTENLAGVAPAVMLLAGHDPLVDEGEAYAERLTANGVSVDVVRFDRQVHSFLTFIDVLDDATTALAAIGKRIQDAVRSAGEPAQ